MPRRFQFSLRTLLESISLAALALFLASIARDNAVAGISFPFAAGAAVGHLFNRGLVFGTIATCLMVLPIWLWIAFAVVVKLFS